VAELVASVDVDASAYRVWDRVVAWERQGEWIPATTVRGTAGGGRGVGARVQAWTGVGRVGFVDTMVITQWEPPHRCMVLHTGRVVRGTGAFEVLALPGGRSRFVWSEWVEPPLGLLGQLGWVALRPLLGRVLARSLRTLARQVAGPDGGA
jgi:hypothetical protein